MSRIGKQIIQIPEKTTVSIQGTTILVKGPLGELKRDFRPLVSVSVTPEGVVLKPVDNGEGTSGVLWGTYASHIKNMVHGVNQMFEKKMMIEGVGYRMEVKGKNLVLNIGYSHQVPVPIPEDVKVSVDKNIVTMTSINKESLGQYAAYIRSLKKPEPYKGKGIRYLDEVIRRKQGKKAA